MVAAFGGGTRSGPIEVAPSLNATAAGSSLDFEVEPFVVEAPVAFSCVHKLEDHGEVAPPLRAMGHIRSKPNGGGQIAIAFAENSRGDLRLQNGDGAITGPLTTEGGKPGQGIPAILEPEALVVRRITPLEAERLQGLPDGFTAVSWRDRPVSAGEAQWLTGQLEAGRLRRTAAGWRTDAPGDGHRYHVIGNGMAEPVVRWILEGIVREDGRRG